MNFGFYEEDEFAPQPPQGRRPPVTPPPPSQGGMPQRRGRKPSGPPPSISPRTMEQEHISAKAVGPRGIRQCMYSYVYIWPMRGRAFWAWLTYVDRVSVAGWRWTGYNWVYFGMALSNIEAYVCY